MDASSTWNFVRFGLLVTGKGEALHLPKLFRSLMATGKCKFEIIRRVGQRSPITSPKRQLQMGRQGKLIPDKDADDIGLPARNFLAQHSNSYCLLIDDLEGDRVLHAEGVFQRYCDALDNLLGPYRPRASVHFLVNMLEAYFFADPKAINEVLGTAVEQYSDDVERIRHPKNALKSVFNGYDEIEHAGQILARLDVPFILSHRDRCASLRTIFAWCSRAIGGTPTDNFELQNGIYDPLTRSQIDALETHLRTRDPT